MKSYWGFTLIELLVTITIMVILMTLAVFSVRSIQVSARDDERKTDVEIIARGLEQRYKTGNPRLIEDTKGSYPGANEIAHAQGQDLCSQPSLYTQCLVSGGYLTQLLPGTTKDSFNTEGVSTSGFVVPLQNNARSNPNHALNIADLQAGKYLYLPFTRSPNIICHNAGECVKFDLYYRTEADGEIHVIKSKNR